MRSNELIVMLTQNDITVPESIEIFSEAKDAPAKNWGFKNVGLSVVQMKKLACEMKSAGKTTFFEVLEEEQASSIKYARLAVEVNFDYFLSLKYFKSVHDILVSGNVKYVPFVGDPRNGRLYGSVEEITNDAKGKQELGVYGINLSAYRYGGNREELVKSILKNTDLSICIAGSVNSYKRLDDIKRFNPWAFTIGGAFFNNVFGDTFSDQITAVVKYLKG